MQKLESKVCVPLRHSLMTNDPAGHACTAREEGVELVGDLYWQLEQTLASVNVDPLQGVEMYCPFWHGAHETHDAVLLVGKFSRRHLLETKAPSGHLLVQGTHAWEGLVSQVVLPSQTMSCLM